MTLFDQTPQLLLVSLLLVLGSSLISIAMARKFSSPSFRYVNCALLLLILISLSLSMKALTDHSYHPQSWVRGWIWPKDESGALVLGVLESGLGLVLGILVTAIAFLVELSFDLDSYGAFSLSTTGTVMALVSATPFMILLGASAAVFGQYLSFAGRKRATLESEFVIRLTRDKLIGLSLAWLGLLALHSEIANSIWGDSLTLIPSETWTQVLSASLIAGGFFMFAGSFPMLAGLGRVSRLSSAARLFQTVLFPGLIAWTVFFREASLTSSLKMSVSLGTCALILSALSALCGLVQSQAQTSLLCWVGSGILTGISILSTNGAIEGTGWMIGVLLASAALYGSLALGDEDATAKRTLEKDNKSTWRRVGIVTAVLVGSAMPGFIGAFGISRWMSELFNTPGILALAIFTWFLGVVLLAKVAILLFSSPIRAGAGWQTVLAPLLLSVLGLGVVWTGTATSGLLPGNADRFMGSLLETLQGSESAGSPNPGVAFYLVTATFGVLIAYLGWGSGKRAHEKWEHYSPRLIQVMREGLGADPFFSGLTRALQAGSEQVELWIDQKLTKQWIPRGLHLCVSRSGAFAFKAGEELSQGISSALRVASDTPGKALQLIQSGNLQWYLLFAIGSGLAMLLHFLRN